jgi:hypothetical protein
MSQRIRLLQLAGEIAAAKFQGGVQAAGFRRTQAWLGSEGGYVAFQQAFQIAVASQQIATQIDGGLPTLAAADEHGEQFGIGQGRRAAFEHFFAGAFGFGPVAYRHHRSVGAAPISRCRRAREFR